MNTSITLQSAIDTLVMGKDSNGIRDAVTAICTKYQLDSGRGKRLVETPEEVAAYAVSRMPATYCAVYTVLEYMCERYQGEVRSLLDLGSGTGAVCWAASEMFELDQITCVERERNMIELAQKLVDINSENRDELCNKKITWVQDSVTSKLQLSQFDLVTASYIMNELNETEKQPFLDNLWDHSNDIMMIIEPGTTIGYENILYARDYFIKRGANIIAPCAHSGKCEMNQDTWCHFACRVERSRLQRYVKYGDAPFEDERYSYLIVTKNEIETDHLRRILFPPVINKGFVNLKVCSENGVEDIKITARNKGVYKMVKKAKWGDSIRIDT